LPRIDTAGIQLRQPGADLFDAIASQAAKTISEDRQRNKPSQLRKFFDELVMWEAKVSGGASEVERKARLDEALPFIRMLNAKAAYAEGRRLVDKNFQELLGHCLRQVEDPATLRHCKLFFEAFLGFYKAYRPSDN
jgi:CRISPR-associated protein Csm2